jgi:hypothetical protein
VTGFHRFAFLLLGNTSKPPSAQKVKPLPSRDQPKFRLCSMYRRGDPSPLARQTLLRAPSLARFFFQVLRTRHTPHSAGTAPVDSTREHRLIMQFPWDKVESRWIGVYWQD